MLPVIPVRARRAFARIPLAAAPLLVGLALIGGGGAAADEPPAAAPHAAPQRVALPLVVRPPSPQRAMELEFVRLLNEERARRGIPPVMEEARLSAYQYDASATLVAETIAAEGVRPGCRHGTRYPLMRAFVLGEALACNVETPAEALDGLLGSPPHAGIILDPDADTVGVGAALIPGSPWGASVFSVKTAVTNVITPDEVRTRALRVLNEQRVGVGLAPFTANAALDRAAQRIAAQTASQTPEDDGDGWWFISCGWDDPTAVAREEGYRGRVWETSLCQQNAGFKRRSVIDRDLARLLGPPGVSWDPWDAAYQAEWRAIGVGVAYAYEDLWPDRMYANSHTFIVVVLGDDPDG